MVGTNGQRRKARRSLAAAALAAICAASGACSSASPVRSVHTGPPAATESAGSGPVVVIPQPRPPGCSTVTGRAPALAHVRIVMTKVSFRPFGSSATADGWDLVGAGLAPSVAIFSNRPGAGPKLVREVSLPGATRALGTHLTSDGKYLLVADRPGGADVVSVSRAVRGLKDAVLGALNASRGYGAIEVTTSPDDGYAFVSLEGSASIAVFNLRRALSVGFSRADFVGFIPVGTSPVGLAVSPDGRWLYATAEVGTLSVINLKTAESRPAKSVMTTVDAGCEPVRVITSASGSVVWVTARGSDALLGFSADRLISAPGKSLVADVRVGEAPVGLALVDGGSKIVVADSDRFDLKGAKSSLAVVDVAAALAGHRALIGFLPAGGFPREMALLPGGRTLLVGNFDSGQLESVDVAELP